MGNKIASNSATLLEQNLAPLLKHEKLFEGTQKSWVDLKKAVQADNDNLMISIFEQSDEVVAQAGTRSHCFSSLNALAKTEVDHKVPVSFRKWYHMQALWLIAAKNGYVKALRVLIDVFPDSRLLFAALVIAAGNHQYDVVDLVMSEKFIDVPCLVEHEQPSYFWLSKRSLSWNFTSFISPSFPHPMMAAVSLIDVEMVKRLLRMGCPVVGRFHEPFPTLQPHYYSVLAWALASNCCTKQLFEVLLPCTDPSGLLECLRVCCAAGQLEWAKTLLTTKPYLLTDNQVKINQTGIFQEPRSPLAEALKANHLNVAKYLLENNASPNKLWYEVRSPLSLMIDSKTTNKQGVNLLLAYGAILGCPMCESCKKASVNYVACLPSPRTPPPPPPPPTPYVNSTSPTTSCSSSSSFSSISSTSFVSLPAPPPPPLTLYKTVASMFSSPVPESPTSSPHSPTAYVSQRTPRASTTSLAPSTPSQRTFHVRNTELSSTISDDSSLPVFGTLKLPLSGFPKLKPREDSSFELSDSELSEASSPKKIIYIEKDKTDVTDEAEDEEEEEEEEIDDNDEEDDEEDVHSACVNAKSSLSYVNPRIINNSNLIKSNYYKTQSESTNAPKKSDICRDVNKSHSNSSSTISSDSFDSARSSSNVAQDSSGSSSNTGSAPSLESKSRKEESPVNATNQEKDITSMSNESMDLADDPLDIACRQQNIDFVRSLLAAKACAHNPSLLHTAAQGKGNTGILLVHLLLEHRADPWSYNSFLGGYPLHEACRASLPKIAELLLNAMERDLLEEQELQREMSRNSEIDRTLLLHVPLRSEKSNEKGLLTQREGGGIEDDQFSNSTIMPQSASSGAGSANRRISTSSIFNTTNSGTGFASPSLFGSLPGRARSISRNSLSLIRSRSRSRSRDGVRERERSKSRAKESGANGLPPSPPTSPFLTPFRNANSPPAPPPRLVLAASDDNNSIGHHHRTLTVTKTFFPSEFLSSKLRGFASPRRSLTVESIANSEESKSEREDEYLVPVHPLRSMRTALMTSLASAINSVSVPCVEFLLSRKASVEGNREVIVAALDAAATTKHDPSQLTTLFRVLIAAKADVDFREERSAINRAAEKFHVLKSLLEAKANIATIFGIDGEAAGETQKGLSGIQDCFHSSVIPLIDHGFIHSAETEMWEQALFLRRSENKVATKAKIVAEAFDRAFTKRRVILGELHQWMLEETCIPIAVMSIVMEYVHSNQKKMWRPGELEAHHHVPVVYDAISSVACVLEGA